MDYKRFVDYDYSTENNCSDRGCDGICRCSTIKDFKITSIDSSGIIGKLHSKYSKSLDVKRDKKISKILGIPNMKVADLYCFDRVFTILHGWDPEMYNPFIRDGYYGQEVDSVDFDSDYKLDKHCEKIFLLDNINDKIRYVLNLEYGDVPFTSSDFELIKIDKSQIHFSNKNHLNSVSSENLDYYNESNYYLPRGVVDYSGGRYEIIDGYHRIFASKSNVVSVWKLINSK